MNRFTEVKMLELAEAYRDQELLWRTDHPKYKDKLARNNAYQEMIDRLNISGLNAALVIRKIKNLRSSYYHELKRIDKGESFGYVPKVAWFPIVNSFLKPYHFSRTQGPMSKNAMIQASGSQSDNSNNSIEFEVEGTSSFYQDGENESGTEDSKFGVLSDANENIGTSQYFAEVEQDESVIPDFVDTDAAPTKKRKVSELNNAIEKLGHLTQQMLAESKNNDEFDIFGKYVAYSLRNLSRENAIRAKKDVQEVVARVQLQDFQEHAI